VHAGDEGQVRGLASGVKVPQLMGSTRYTQLPIGPLWKSKSQRQCGPDTQSIVHLLVGQAPECAQQRQEYERLWPVETRYTSWPCGQRKWAGGLSQSHGDLTEFHQTQTRHDS
jgi:hypothetical protein